MYGIISPKNNLITLIKEKKHTFQEELTNGTECEQDGIFLLILLLLIFRFFFFGHSFVVDLHFFFFFSEQQMKNYNVIN